LIRQAFRERGSTPCAAAHAGLAMPLLAAAARHARASRASRTFRWDIDGLCHRQHHAAEGAMSSGCR
jgi:hypothetical protein